MIYDVIHRIQCKLLKFRLQPIRVFCFHQVSETFNPLSGWECDWIQTDAFKRKVLSLKEEYSFITLQEAHDHLSHDTIRTKKYAVLTSDDGMQSLSSILPWLEEQHIPITLFLSANYLDGKSYYSGYDAYWEKQGVDIPALSPSELYLTKEQIGNLQSPMYAIGIHGWKHEPVLNLTDDEFKRQTNMAIDCLSRHARYIPFYAYTYGRHTIESDAFVRKQNLVPVLCDGEVNVKYDGYIHRESL